MKHGRYVIAILLILPVIHSAVNFATLYQHLNLPKNLLQIRRESNDASHDPPVSNGMNTCTENSVNSYERNGNDDILAESFMEQPYMDQETEDDCSTFPNNTNIAPHFFPCSSSFPALLYIHDAAVMNSTGDDHFPVDFSQEVRFSFDVTSYANRRYDNLGVEITLYKRSNGWLGCGWLYIPTFGLISNYHLCDENPSCPVVPGRQIFEVTIDPSILFSGFFKMFHSKQVPYQMTLRVRNNQIPSEELLCVTYQTRIHY